MPQTVIVDTRETLSARPKTERQRWALPVHIDQHRWNHLAQGPLNQEPRIWDVYEAIRRAGDARLTPDAELIEFICQENDTSPKNMVGK